MSHDSAEAAAAEADPATLAAARAGDHQAFGRLVRRHQGRVRRQLRRLCDGDAARADDLAQDVFVQAWQALPGFRGDAALTTWLHRLAYTRFLMDRRAAAARPRAAGMPTLADDPEPEVVQAGAFDERRATEAAAPADPGPLRLDLLRALAALPPDEHDALIHCLALEFTLPEAADVLGVPQDTLKGRLARARARLRTALADWRPKETLA